MALTGSFVIDGYQDKYMTFEWSATQNITGNTSTISWKLLGGDPDGGYVKAGGFKVVIDGDTEYSVSTDTRIKMYTGTLIASGAKTVTHTSDGSRDFTVYVEAGIYTYAVNSYGEATFTLDTIPRKSSLSVDNGTLGTEQTLTVTRQTTNFTHSIKAVCGSSTLYIKADGSTSATEEKHSECSIAFFPPIDWASQNTTGISVSVTYTITTYNESANIGSNEYTKTYSIPESVKPICALAVSDPMGYAATFGAFIQGKSKFNLSAGFTAAYGSEIVSKSITADGKIYPADISATDAIKNSGKLTIDAAVTDKRGRKGTDSVIVNVAKYAKPTISKLSVARCRIDGTADATGAYCKVIYSYAIDDFSEAENALGITMTAENEPMVRLGYKKSHSTAWSSVLLEAAYSASEAEYIFSADEDASYNVRLVISDSFDSATKTTAVSTAEVLMHFGSDGKSIALGKISEKSNAIELGKTAYDRFGTIFGNGLAYFGDGVIDPDITLESLILTNVKTPVSGLYYFIHTNFDSTKSATANRMQYAYPYESADPPAYRFCHDGEWSNWFTYAIENNIVAITQAQYDSGNWSAPEGAFVVVLEPLG